MLTVSIRVWVCSDQPESHSDVCVGGGGMDGDWRIGRVLTCSYRKGTPVLMRSSLPARHSVSLLRSGSVAGGKSPVYQSRLGLARSHHAVLGELHARSSQAQLL